MKKPIIARDVERPFTMGELFFSTTDRKGIIRSGNQVFVRVSGHPLDELLGAPHNIIRHPDMPKAVFKLLWDYLGEQKPFAGYVKNLAADGSYYWVMALVVPIDDGYLSIRFKPSSQIFGAVRSLYADMLATEKKAGDRWRDGMRDATAQLVDSLHRLGFADYDDFMHTALATEMTAHQNAARAHAAPLGQRGADPALAAMLESCEQASRSLGDVFSHVDAVVQTVNELESKATFLLDLSSQVHLVSLNALIASCRLERGGEGLSVVTQNLAENSQSSTATIDAITRQLLSLTKSLRHTAFTIAAATLQVEMTAFFLRELMARSGDSSNADTTLTRGDILTLTLSLDRSSQLLADALPKTRAPLTDVIRVQQDLRRDLRRLSSVHIIGKIQSAGIGSESNFRELLADIDAQLQKANAELEALTGGLATMREKRIAVLERLVTNVTQAVGAFRGLAAA